MLEGLQQLMIRPIPDSILGWGLFLLFLLSVFVDISKIKLNPWKRILRSVSKVFNAEIIASQKELQQKLDITCSTFQQRYSELFAQINKMQDDSLVWQKQTCRRKIIEFADECRRGVRHSQQMFNNIFDDINTYEELCDLTKDPNHVITESVAYIRETYHYRLAHNDFI